MSLFFWYVSWASWWNAVLLVNPVNWIGVRPPHLCALSGFRKQYYTVCLSASSVASGFGLQVNNLLHLWPHVVLNRVFLHEIQVALIRQGAVGNILVMHTISGEKNKKSIYYSKHALHKYPTVRYNYKNMTAGTEQRAVRCQRGKPGKPNKHFIKCKTTSLNFKSFISWLLAHIAATSVQMQVGSKSEQHARCCSRPIIYFANVQHLLCIWVWCGIQSGCVLQD